MTIMLEGTLAVQRISGVNGEFSVGKLETEVGVLNLKDPHLDQYEPGKYAGRFLVDRIFPHGYMSKTNCFIVEIRAFVREYIIHTDEPAELDTEVGLTEEDPLETAVTVPEVSVPAIPQLADAVPLETPVQTSTLSQQPKPVPSANLKPEKAVQDQQGQPDDTLAELFGELWPLADTVTLDPTTVRSDAVNHRKRTQYLKSQGYLFKATSQSWVKQGRNVNAVEVTIL